ncbi:MAG: hypothetical protein R2708_20230 [Vicinamibacterales bacterium]
MFITFLGVTFLAPFVLGVGLVTSARIGDGVEMNAEIAQRMLGRRGRVAAWIVTIALLAGPGVAHAQNPTVQLSRTVVPPGAATLVTVTGSPGENFAIVGSTRGAGFSYGGLNFSVGADFVLLAMSTLDGSGRAVVSVTPPFAGSELDRYSTSRWRPRRRRRSSHCVCPPAWCC